jgi:hypothetical protein
MFIGATAVTRADPVTIAWTLPEGVSAGAINWPVPEKETDKAGDTALVTYIYTHQVVLLTPIKLADSLRPARSRSRPPCIGWSARRILRDDRWRSRRDVHHRGGNKTVSRMPHFDRAMAQKGSAACRVGRGFGVLAEQPSRKQFAAGHHRVEKWQRRRRIFIQTPAQIFPWMETTETLPASNGVIRLRKMLTKNDASMAEVEVTGVLVGDADSPQARELKSRWPSSLRRQAEKKSAAPVASAALATMLVVCLPGRADSERHAVRPAGHRAENIWLCQTIGREAGAGAEFGIGVWSGSSRFFPDSGRIGHRCANGRAAWPIGATSFAIPRCKWR